MSSVHRALSLLTVVGALSVPTTATGATYPVHSCKEGVRESLPSTDWTREPGGGSFDVLVDCSAGAVILKPSDGTTIPYGGGAGVTFTAPEPLSLIGYKHRMTVRALKSTDSSHPWRWDYISGVTELSGDAHPSGGCNAPCNEYIFNAGSTFPKPLRSLTWYFLCTYSGSDCPSGGAELRIFDAEFEVDDPTSPKFSSSPTGSIFSGDAELAGAQTTGYDVSDSGSGVYRVELLVDGTVVGSQQSSSDQYPHCVMPFRTVQPCPARVINGITFDTSSLADGPHTALLRAFDATDHNLVTYGPVVFSTANRRLRNFCGSDSLRASTNVPRQPVPFGSAWTYRARVRDATGMDVVLLQGRDRVRVVGSGRIGRDGRVEFRVPPGTNRLLRLAVRSPGSTTAYACSRPTRLRVAAKVLLSANPEEVSNGRMVRLRGRLLGVANAGRPVIVQARAVGSRRWSTVRLLRTRQDGRFHMKYRFLSTFSTVTYIFRAQARSGKGYPFATGSSKQRRVRVYGSGA